MSVSVSFKGYELLRITPKLQVILHGIYFGLFPGFRFKAFQPMILWLLRLIGDEFIRITPKLHVILRGVYFGLFPRLRFKLFQPMILWLLRLIRVYVFVVATLTGWSILATPTGKSIQKINITYNTVIIIIEG